MGADPLNRQTSKINTQSKVNGKSFGKEQINMSLPTILSYIISDLQNSPNREAAYQVLDNACLKVDGFKALDVNVFNYKGYQLLATLQMYAEPVAKKLLLANELNVRALPQLIENINIGNEINVLVTHQAGCEDKTLIPYSEVRKQITPNAKTQFLKDIEALASYNLIHKQASRGTDSWLVNPVTGEIHLSSWDALQETNNSQEKRESIQAIKNHLNKP